MLLPFKKLTSAVAGTEKVSDFDFKKGYPDVNQNMAWANIETYARQAVRSYILPLVGRDLYDDICTKIAANSLTTAQTEFAEMLRDVAALYTVMVALPRKKTIIASMGAVENTASDGTTASSLWGFKTTMWAVTQDADRMMDELLAFIETTAATSGETYFNTNWKSKPVADVAATAFFRNVGDFQKYHPISRSLRTFRALQPIINEEAERQILPILRRPQFDALAAALKTGTSTTAQTALAHQVRKALAKWAVWQATMTLPVLPDQDGFRVISNIDAVDQKSYSQEVMSQAIQGLREGAERSAKTCTADLIEFLYANQADYPLWFDALPAETDRVMVMMDGDRGGVFI